MNLFDLTREAPTRGFGQLEQQVLKRWRSIQHLFTFLHREMNKMNETFFGGELSLPRIQIKPMRLARRPHEEFSSSAYYAPAYQDRPAEIGLFPNVLLDPHEARIALAHELVHHWEWTAPADKPSENFTTLEIDEDLHHFFKNPSVEKSWRQHHSPRFIAKAHEIAGYLNIPLRDFLFKK